jgi:hypothetical protein
MMSQSCGAAISSHGHLWLDHAFSTVAQTDDLHCFFRGFHSRRVADVQKCPEVGDLLTVMRSECCVCCAGSLSVRKKWPR